MIYIYVGFGVVVVWLAVLSFFLLRSTQHYKRLTKGSQAGSIDQILDKILEKNDIHAKDIKTLNDALQKLDEDRHSYMQRFGYVKFNPFNDRVGGDQSFVIALLDNKQNGFVKTCMYTRDGVRVYVKPIKGGKSLDYELSQEEKEAIKKAS